MEPQVDFESVHLGDNRHIILFMTDTGKRLTEAVFVENRSTKTIVESLVPVCIFRHGVPSSLSGDDELYRAPITLILSTNHIVLKARPTRGYNKTGILELRIQTLKIIMRKLHLKNPAHSANHTVTRASSQSNVFVRDCHFELIPAGSWMSTINTKCPMKCIVSRMLDAYIEQMATKPIQRALRASKNNKLDSQVMHVRDMIWVRYALTKASKKTNESLRKLSTNTRISEKHRN